jgi:hypothetical protein
MAELAEPGAPYVSAIQPQLGIDGLDVARSGQRGCWFGEVQQLRIVAA